MTSPLPDTLARDLDILIVEDERPARSELKRMLRSLGMMGEIREASSVTEALIAETSSRPDLILLDIQMPGGSGFDLLRQLGPDHPPVIFTTAYEQFAAKAFEEEAVDYLLKPFNEKRLAKALARLPFPDRQSPPLTHGDSILLKVDGECLLLPVESIDLMVTTGNTTEVFWGDNKGKVNKPMKYFVKKLDSSLFFRATRDQLINVQNLVSLRTNDEGLVEAKLPHKRQVTFSRRQSILFRKSHKI
jgi:two-component system LytT family response regulator